MKFTAYFTQSLLVIISTIFISSCTGKNDQAVSLESLLEEMADRSAISYFPEEEFSLKQFSSYDRASVAPGKDGWFANADFTRFIREEEREGRREFIMFEHTGPGAITRWWMTFAGEGSHDGTVRIYIDNKEEPLIEANILELLSGGLLAGAPLSSSVSELTEYHQRGHNLYLPIPYAEYCRVSYECDAVNPGGEHPTPSVYYNICYREYDPGIKVHSLDMAHLSEHKKLIDKVNDMLMEGPGTQASDKTLHAAIAPGDTVSLEIIGRGRAIDVVRLIPGEGFDNQALRSVLVSMIFDGDETVWIPAGEFFGTGYARNESNTWYSSVSSDGAMSTGWIMPFKNNCEIRLINFGEEAVSADLEVSTTKYKWGSNSMYFCASWHEYNRVQSAGDENSGGSGKHFDISFIDIQGKGVYAGDAITVFNTADAWWGEGDEKIFVDGESFPSFIGTGTEDYYGYAWCRPEIFSHPFIAQPCGSGNFHPGMTVNLRYRSLDGIPFKSSISSNIELWHWAPALINYALSTFWYAMPGHETSRENDPEMTRKRVALKRSDLIMPAVSKDGEIEGEDLEVVSSSDGIYQNQYIGGWGWSKDGQLWWRNAGKGSKLETRFTCDEAGNYSVNAVLTKAPDYGIVSFRINNGPVVKSYDGYSPHGGIARVSLGTAGLNEGENFLNLEITGANTNAKPGNMVGIDLLRFDRLK